MSARPGTTDEGFPVQPRIGTEYSCCGSSCSSICGTDESNADVLVMPSKPRRCISCWANFEKSCRPNQIRSLFFSFTASVVAAAVDVVVLLKLLQLVLLRIDESLLLVSSSSSSSSCNNCNKDGTRFIELKLEKETDFCIVEEKLD